MTDSITSRSFCIYKVTNSVNSKVYIGLTTRGLKRRWQFHIRAALNGSSVLFHNAIRKHGVDAFSIELIEECPDHETMLLREQYWIHYYNSVRPNGYNITAGGEGSLGVKLNAEQKQRLSEMRMGHAPHPNAIAAMREWNLGNHPSAETRKRMHYGKCHLTDEQAAIAKFNAYGLMQREYAALFGVTSSTIGYIITGKTYTYITPEHLPLSLYKQQLLWEQPAPAPEKKESGRDKQGRFIVGTDNNGWKEKKRNSAGQFLPRQKEGGG